jgi:hypothetical protein
MDDQLVPREYTALRAVELLMAVYSRGGATREQARLRLELHPISSPEAMTWFDVRWPEGPP